MLADGKTVAERGGNWLTRSAGFGYPEMASVVDTLEELNQGS